MPPQSKARLVITAVVIEKRPVAEVVRDYGVSRSWLYELLARYKTEGEAALEPHSRRPKTNPNATPSEVVELVLALRKQLVEAGHDAGAETIVWHLKHRHSTALSKATVHRILTRHAAVAPEPKKRPRSSYIRFEASMPNESWQSDLIHYRLTQPDGKPGADVEIITWLDDHSRYALHLSAHARITAAIVADTFTKAAGQHGYPASTLTDNGMVYTVRHPGLRTPRRPQRPRTATTRVERGPEELPPQPPHHLRQGGEVPADHEELATRPGPPASHHRRTPDPPGPLRDRVQPAATHRSLPHRATPATIYHARPKATPRTDRSRDTHDRVRVDTISKAGNVTLRVAGRLRHIASAEPTPEPASTCSSRTSTSASSTPPPANYSAN